MALNDIKVPKENSGGTFDEVTLTPSDIGAQSIFLTEDLGTITANVQLTAARAKIYTVTVNTFDTPTPSVRLPQTGVQAGDVVQIRFTTFTGREMPVLNGDGSFLGNSLKNGQRATYIAASTSNNSWAEDATNRHTHVVADVTGAAASGSITSSGLTQATARILGRTTASTGAIEEIQIGTGLSLSAGELSSTVSAGIPATLLDAKGDLIVGSADNTAARLAVGGTNGHVLTVDSAETLGVKWAAASYVGAPIEYVIACSDETSDLATGTAKVTFRAPVAFLLTAVAASVNTAPTGSTLIVDINNGANSTLSTKLSIDASEKTSATAASAAVIDTAHDDIAADAEITIDIDQIGSTVAGKGLKVILKGTRA
jgi:hypothetical protein